MTRSVFPTGGISTDVLVVFLIILAALVLFVTQPVPIDITAITIMVVLILLEPWTGVTPTEGVSGFSNPATVTVLAMFILSEGVRQTGVIQLLTRQISKYTGDSQFRTLVATVGMSGPTAGFVNNTPVVAILIPATMELAEKIDMSPSKLLIPLSFASMMGGTLTLIGTSSNLLASDVWARQGGPEAQPFTMFEFTQLGIIVLVVGIVYLLTVGRYLTPERISVTDDPAEGYGMTDYLTDLVVREDSTLVGKRVRDLRNEEEFDFDTFQIVRDGRTIVRGVDTERIRAGDILSVRADEEALSEAIANRRVNLLADVIASEESDEDVTPADLRAIGADQLTSTSGQKGTDTGSHEKLPENDDSGEDFEKQDDDAEPPEEDIEDRAELTEVVLLAGSWISGRDIRVAEFQRQHGARVLAVRRGSEVTRRQMNDVPLAPGDTLLVRSTPDVLERLRSDRRVVVSSDREWEGFDRSKIPIAIGIIVGVVGLAGAGVMPIMVSALAGVVAMIFTGCLRPADAYEAVNWDVIFLLAGVIPLGIALEQSGGADLLAGQIVAGSAVLPAIVLLGVFYLFTATLTELISNNAAIVLMVPIAIDVASRIDANAFAFVLAVTFAASTPMLSPVGYQTNLMVYGPGGYKFTDFARVGLPLQLLLTVVTSLGIAFFWGVQ